METAGLIATVATGSIAIVAAVIKMMRKNGFLCECKGCGCECKIDGRKSETRRLELANKTKQLEIQEKQTRKTIFNYSRKQNKQEKEIQTPEFIEIELKEDNVQRPPTPVPQRVSDQ